MPMSMDADADVDADDDANADGDQNADANVDRHFITNHPIYKCQSIYMTMVMMLTSSDGDDIDLDGDIKNLGVRIMGSRHRHLFTSKIDDMTMAIRRYGDDGNMTMAKKLTLSDGTTLTSSSTTSMLATTTSESRLHY